PRLLSCLLTHPPAPPHISTLSLHDALPISLTANDAPTRAASPVGSRHPTTKLMAARAAGRQAIRIAHLRVHEEWHVSIGTVSRKMSRRGYRAGAISPASITLCWMTFPSIF